ncbi:hypothetical protein HRbin15_02580 [bacterium HR15]|nr:hypothetical protein HRbin15_02580 [bacterium HR15]
MRIIAFRLLTALSAVAIGLLSISFTAFSGRYASVISEVEVLKLLDETMTFGRVDIPPPPDIYNINAQFVEGRLSVLRNESRWVLAFELICYEPGACAYEHRIWLYGNCIRGQVWWRIRELPIPIYEEHLWDNTTGAFLMPRDHIRIRYDDQILEFSPTPAEYAAAGILFPPERQHTNDIEPLELLAYLCWKLNSPFFLSREELEGTVRDAVDEETGDLKLIFQTREWQHPNFDEEEHPSQLPGIQLLAHLVATGEPAVWEQLDPEWVNTRFAQVVQRNWEFIYPPSHPPSMGESPVYLLLPFSPDEWEEVPAENDESNE